MIVSFKLSEGAHRGLKLIPEDLHDERQLFELFRDSDFSEFVRSHPGTSLNFHSVEKTRVISAFVVLR